MTFLELIDRMGERRRERWIAHGQKSIWDRLDPRFLIAVTIIALFAIAFLREADKDTRNLMVGALIAAFAGAWGYYLGSSNSAQRAGDRQDQALALADRAVKALPVPPIVPEPPEVTLEPGQTARVAAAPADDRGQS